MLWEWDNSRKQVFILDLDGTLMPSAEIDNKCFWQAVFDCFGDRGVLPDLHGFTDVTDSGILNEWCVRELGRLPRLAETRRIRQLFLQLLESAWIHQPLDFSPMPGLINWLETVGESGNVRAGIATGGWQHSARAKLRLSGLDRFDLPLATSDDAMNRIDIMRIAARRTLPHPLHEEAQFIGVGDGPWDLQASRDLGWGFIGIASGARARRLEQAGASIIRRDFCKN